MLFRIMLVLLILFPLRIVAAEIEMEAGQEIADPYWFKQSFLELEDDASEAAEENRQVLLYFHQKGCPYCYAMVRNNFLDPQLSGFIRDHFDVISLNIWGDREVTLADGSVLSEKALAEKWKIQYTPTLVFLKPTGEAGLRIDGYRPKAVFSKILDYVVSGNQDTPLSQLLIEKSASSMYSQPYLLSTQAMVAVMDQPKALLVEYPGCKSCNDFHTDLLARPDVNAQLKYFAVARIDATSDQRAVFPDGRTMPAADWVREAGLSYFPSLILYDRSGQEQLRIDSYVRAFHLNSALEYVSAGHFERYKSFQRYISDKADHMRESGQAVLLTE